MSPANRKIAAAVYFYLLDRDVAKALFSTAADISSIVAMQGRFPLTPAMKTLYSRIAAAVDSSSARTADAADIISRHLSSLGACKIPTTAEIIYQRSSVEISNLVGMYDYRRCSRCLVVSCHLLLLFIS